MIRTSSAISSSSPAELPVRAAARGRDLFLTLGQQSDLLAPPAGRGRRCRRFLFRKCRIGATLAPTATSAGDRDRTESGTSLREMNAYREADALVSKESPPCFLPCYLLLEKLSKSLISHGNCPFLRNNLPVLLENVPVSAILQRECHRLQALCFGDRVVEVRRGAGSLSRRRRPADERATLCDRPPPRSWGVDRRERKRGFIVSRRALARGLPRCNDWSELTLSCRRDGCHRSPRLLR